MESSQSLDRTFYFIMLFSYYMLGKKLGFLHSDIGVLIGAILGGIIVYLVFENGK